MDPDYTENKSTIKTYILEFIQTLAVCLVIGVIIYWQVAQPHKVSGLSMSPNFHNGDYIITNKVLYKLKPPQRGDVVVLQSPTNSNEDFIKRVIALPGERFKIQDGKVYINGQILHEPYINQAIQTSSGRSLPEGVEMTVDPGTYVVLGDNRGASSDSREWGFLAKEKIIGQVFLRYWPQEFFGLIPGGVKY